ncbi:universal stress protein [Streptomyces sp. NPDC048751]|uniref:universal stress protein n=1 Tax=Streptomyces sp. NPDC048751 TaxID=3365591 RepID=UPI00370FCE98
MELPLVVGVDGSEGSLVAVDWAVDEAARRGVPLRLVHAWLRERQEGAAPVDRGTPEDVVGAAEERARRRDAEVKATGEVLAEEAVAALLHAGRNASALVTGVRGHGRLKDLLLGSVSPAVAARASCPVIVVRGDKAGLAGTHNRIVLGVGDPATTGEAVRFAFEEAQERACTLDVVRAWRRPAHRTAVHPLAAGDTARRHEAQASVLLDTALRDAFADHPALRVSRSTVEGPARKVLLHRSAAADLLIIGARQRHGHHGLQVGGVAHTLLHHAQCPVAVVPHRV